MVDFCIIEWGIDCNKRYELDINENSVERCDVLEDELWFDLCFEKSDELFGVELVLIEKCCLFNFSCYSGDFLIF